MLVRMNKILFLALFMLSVNGMAQSTTTQSSFKNRAVSTKNYVINDRQETYSFRGVFTLNKRESIKSKIEQIIGLPKYYQGEMVWSNINYTISLKEGEVKANLVKNSDAEFYYYKMKELEKELIFILDNPGPKNIAVSTKSYVLNDNATLYSLKAVFHNRKNETVKELIELQFGKPKMDGNKLVWNDNGNYNIELLDGVARINFGKSSDNEFYYNKVKTLGIEIVSILN